MQRNNRKSKKSSTRLRRFVTNLRISKLLVGLLILAVFKLALVAVWSFDEIREKAAEAIKPKVEELQQTAAGVRLKVLADNVALAAESDAKNASAQAPAKPAGVSEEDWKALKAREDELNRRELSLNALEQEIEQKLQQLTAMREDIQKMLDQANVLKDKKIKHLVDVYSNMKAQQAANVIETMDQDLAVKILSGMRGRQAGEILTYVKPEKAAKLSEELTTLQVPFQNN
jgi:flagellar motility protein MotE (MotC chaperone)